jgi:hypothetical protein
MVVDFCLKLNFRNRQSDLVTGMANPGFLRVAGGTPRSIAMIPFSGNSSTNLEAK